MKKGLVVVFTLSVFAGTSSRYALAEGLLERLSENQPAAATAVPVIPKPSTPYDEAKDVSDAQRTDIVTRKATCPFIGTAVAVKKLLVLNSASQPLGSIDVVRALGNSGGGDLGDFLTIFAQGNHAYMPGPDGKLTKRAPVGLFSLDFPGSQGSHPGDSRILVNSWNAPGSGRFNDQAFERLLSHKSLGPSGQYYLKRSEVGKFIAENLFRDTQSQVLGRNRTLFKLAGDIRAFLATVRPYMREKIRNQLRGTKDSEAKRDKLIALTKTLGQDNLIGSAGEFALLFAFLLHSPNTKGIGGEPALAVSDVTAMFQGKTFPAGWENWRKNTADWVIASSALSFSAEKEYRRLTFHK